MGDDVTELRRLINRRIRNLEIILLESLTPLLRNQIRHTIRLHTEALEHPNIGQYVKDLDALHRQVMEHWKEVYKDIILRAYLMEDIMMFQQFLTAKLLEDYTKKPYTIDPWVLSQVNAIEKQYAKADDDSNTDSGYQLHVVFPLEEMMLNRDHVENKLRSAVMEQEHLGSGIQRLIDRRDWLELATALTNDRDLALNLFKERPLNPNSFNENTRKKVLQSIDEIKNKYAKEMLAGRASNNTDCGSPLPTPPALASSNPGHRPEPSRRNGFAWNIFNMVASSLTGTNSSPNTNLEESTSLIKAE